MYLIDKNWVTNYIKKGKILDIGCSGGFFLSKFLNNDFELEGVEIGEDAAQFAKENFNINVEEVGAKKERCEEVEDVDDIWEDEGSDGRVEKDEKSQYDKETRVVEKS